MQDDGRVRTSFNLDESASFLYVLYTFYNTLCTMLKRSRKVMFNSDSSDDKYYFEPDEIENNDNASDRGNEVHSTRNRLRHFKQTKLQRYWSFKYEILYDLCQYTNKGRRSSVSRSHRSI